MQIKKFTELQTSQIWLHSAIIALNSGMDFYRLFRILESTYTSYTGIVLHEFDQKKLLQQFRDRIPHDWVTTGDHMTINIGPASEGPARDMLGQPAEMQVRNIGVSPTAIAVKVETKVPSQNQVKHITLAYGAGGTARDSNDIQKWEPVEPFVIRGTIQEVQKEGEAPKERPIVAPKPPAPNDPVEFIKALAGKPIRVITQALKGKFPHLSDEEINQLINSGDHKRYQ